MAEIGGLNSYLVVLLLGCMYIHVYMLIHVYCTSCLLWLMCLDQKS